MVKKRKKSSGSVARRGREVTVLKKELSNIVKQAKSLAARGKARYDKLDADTKRRALWALGLLAGLLAARATAKAIRSRKGKSRR